MPRFAANLTLMYTEHPFLERFAAAAADGFDAVEYLYPYAFSPEEVARWVVPTVRSVRYWAQIPHTPEG